MSAGRPGDNSDYQRRCAMCGCPRSTSNIPPATRWMSFANMPNAVEWRSSKIYSDEGKSGLNIEGRDSLAQMIQDVQDGKVQFFLHPCI